MTSYVEMISTHRRDDIHKGYCMSSDRKNVEYSSIDNYSIIIGLYHLFKIRIDTFRKKNQRR